MINKGSNIQFLNEIEAELENMSREMKTQYKTKYEDTLDKLKETTQVRLIVCFQVHNSLCKRHKVQIDFKKQSNRCKFKRLLTPTF